MQHLDLALTRLANGYAGELPVLDALMVALSTYAVPLLVLAVAVQWWRRGDRDHVRHVLLAVGLSFLLGLAINQLILLFVHRIRPYDAGITHLLVAPSPDPSFPSDHATATVAIAAAFLLHRMWRTGATFTAGAILVCFSRVFVGTHYASDVFGGALTGIVAATIVRATYWEGTALDRRATRIF